MRRLLILLAILAVAIPSSARLRFGLKGGIAINKLMFNKDIIGSENRAGFTCGFQLEFALPVTGLSIDGSVMYSYRKDALSTQEQVFRRDYIELPLHVKYGLTLAGINKVLVPYAFTGPNFSFLFNESKQELWDNRSSNTSWDIGFGVELFHHLQVQASYTIGLTQSFKQITSESLGEAVKGRDRCWTISCCFMF